MVGERKQVDFAVNWWAKWIEEEIEVKLRNHKEVPVTVLVKENLYRWSNWKIIEMARTTWTGRRADHLFSGDEVRRMAKPAVWLPSALPGSSRVPSPSFPSPLSRGEGQGEGI